jgi:predicted ATPase
MIPFFGAHGMVLRGWALAKQGQADDGVARLRDGIAAYRATGADLESSHWLGLLAEACGDAHPPEEGLTNQSLV